MNCNIYSIAGIGRSAAGLCGHCGAALCEEHLKEAQDYRIGGTTAYGCPHPIARASGGRRALEVRPAGEDTYFDRMRRVNSSASRRLESVRSRR
jgi:hypothetical protein